MTVIEIAGLVAVVAVLAFAVMVGLECRRKNMHLWLGSYLRRRRPSLASGPVHVMFAFVDHYEPQWGRPTYGVEVERVALTFFPQLTLHIYGFGAKSPPLFPNE